MSGVEPDSVIGHPDAESERRAKQMSAGLDAESPGRREGTLLRLAQLWFPSASCFHARPPHAMPTPALLESVARCAGEEQRDAVRLAAIVATRAGWKAFRVARTRDPAGASRLEVPAASVAAIRDALGATSGVLRINAARLLAEFPRPELLPVLRSALADRVWTVRWNAVRAIAALEPDDSLVEVLRRSQPRDAASVVAQDFRRAVAALKERDLSMPAELSRYDGPA